ncbi:MAG: Hint domain-containing protein [Roseinatronobacter sp.]
MVYNYECEVFEGTAFRATWGINEGESLGALSELCLGDRYALAPQTEPLHLTLVMGQAIRLHTVTGPASGILIPGARVSIQGELKFMSLDGELVSTLLLLSGSAAFILPLNPMRIDTDYTLIAVDPDVTDLRMSELVAGCFAPGARVTLGDGRLCPVEALSAGQMLRTRDHGPKPLRWIGRVTARAHGPFAPVTFPAGSLGNLGALTVGPLQRIFLYQRSEERLGTQAEILVQAQYLVDGRRVLQREGGYAEYYSLVFDQHQIIYVEGIPVESMLVSRATLERLPAALAQDLTERFPHLNQHAHFAQELPAGQMTDDLRAAILRNKEK